MTAPTPPITQRSLPFPGFLRVLFLSICLPPTVPVPPKIRASHDFGNCLSPVQYNTLPVGWKGQAGAIRIRFPACSSVLFILTDIPYVQGIEISPYRKLPKTSFPQPPVSVPRRHPPVLPFSSAVDRIFSFHILFYSVSETGGIHSRTYGKCRSKDSRPRRRYPEKVKSVRGI
mgnify:CR=1 FL=1